MRDSDLYLHFAFVAIALTVFYRIRYRKARALPPGPSGLPFVGSMFQMSKTPWKDFEQWKSQYGPLMYFTSAGQGILVLNTHEAAADLLDRRGPNYSDRPRGIVASEIIAGGLLLAFTSYDAIWRRKRRAVHEAMSKSRVIEYQHIHSREALLLADGVLLQPNAWESEIHRALVSSILSILYGLPGIHSINDPVLTNLEEFGEAVVRASNPGAHIVEFFPWMKYIPSCMAKWKREAEELHAKYSTLFMGLVGDVETQIKSGDERPTAVGKLIREQDRLNIREASWLAAELCQAGFGTTISTMTWFMLAMIAFPEKQKKCQDELDAVVGRSRVPTFKDRDHLPYVRATVREALRWRPPAPIGFPHITKEDDWYSGHFIPKGTMCLANIWSLNRDRTVYGEDADDFNPDRFIDEEGRLRPALVDTKDEGHVTFGFGQRICVGRHIANNALFINIATMLWATNISPLKDDSGAPIIPSTMETVEIGPSIRPLPFGCSITPRFPEAAAIVEQTRELL